MRVVLLTSRVGHKLDQVIGQVIDVDEAEGGRLLASGQARLADDAKEKRNPVETAAKRAKV